MKNTADTSFFSMLRAGPARLEALAAICAGLMATMAMPPFHDTGLLIIPALAILFSLVIGSTHPVRVAFIFGVAHQVSLIYWLFLLIPDASLAYRWLIPAYGAVTMLYVASYYLLWGVAVKQIRKRAGTCTTLMLMPVLWVGMEFARSSGELGFPWCLTGVASLGTPFYPLASVMGEAGLGAAAAMIATCLVLLKYMFAEGTNRRQWLYPGMTVLLLTSFCFLLLILCEGPGDAPRAVESGTVPERSAPVRIGVVQANVDLGDKWKKGRGDSTRIPYTKLTDEVAGAGAELVVWAETAVPAYLLYRNEWLSWVKAVADSNDIFLYTGFPDAVLGEDNDHQRFNGSGVFGPNGLLRGRYRKHHLLPFGERMPFQAVFPWLGRMDMGQAEWMPGARPAPILVDPDGGRFQIAGLICYESIFSRIPAGAVAAGADFLVNITNDGWFGITAGPIQHAEMARMRAAEYGVPVVRCANNGVSFITDDRGRLISALELGEQGVIVADVPPGNAGTFYAEHGRRSLLIILLLWAALSFVVGGRYRHE
jgi:apolipoprotein N-acyltransferase